MADFFLEKTLSQFCGGNEFTFCKKRFWIETKSLNSTDSISSPGYGNAFTSTSQHDWTKTLWGALEREESGEKKMIKQKERKSEVSFEKEIKKEKKGRQKHGKGLRGSQESL